jgi:UrcA family protein
MNFASSFKHAGLWSACVGALLFSVGAAHAASTERVVVYYGDLNLSAPTGVKSLYSRIKRAAQLVCGPAPDARELERAWVYERCTSASFDDAVKRIDEPLISVSKEGAPAEAVH